MKKKLLILTPSYMVHSRYALGNTDLVPISSVNYSLSYFGYHGTETGTHDTPFVFKPLTTANQAGRQSL